MDVAYSVELADDLLAQTWARDAAAHVSAGTAVASIKELTLCLRKSWRQRERSPSGREPLSGLSSQTTLKILMGTAFGKEINPDEERCVIPLGWGEISGRADVVVDDNGVLVPCELKVTWSYLDKVGISPQYFEQLAGYCLSYSTNYGRLYIVEAPKPRIQCLEVRFTEEELEGWHEELDKRASLVNGEREPSEEYRYSWECRDCRENVTNGGTCKPVFPGTNGRFFDQSD